MCAYIPPIRLFVDCDLVKGATLSLDKERAHYLGHVMRRSAGDRLEIFNGRTNSFIGELTDINRKSASVQLVELCAEFKPSPDIWFLFSPVKRTRLDFMAQKATELGVRHIQPVNTDYCQVSKVNLDRLSANAVEAAEQTGRLDVPSIGHFIPLHQLLEEWPVDRHLIFCDEALSTNNQRDPLAQLRSKPVTKAGLLIGPEGGFSDTERDQIRKMPSVRPLSLGPRILRSDTAALAALSLFQAVWGDWSVSGID
ncbi:MAG: 16S rRNA (uracil(1498)-N(3))-methyltransferase [Rhodospirillaceae bacterium]|nr:16S rRNA (uracil(1498)-N(3))-methyltransferase [Rhodospirillaceae bacterium]